MMNENVQDRRREKYIVIPWLA